ncbi:MAG: creatininase family protein [Pseudomonadota bacterium]
MLLSLATWPEIDRYLENRRSIVIPIGSTEQHGPNGLLGTDAICPEVIAKSAAELSDKPMLVGPTFNVGCAQHHLAFSGTITLRPSTMIAAIHDWCASLRQHGFQRIYWLNGHGGNVATIGAAFAEVYAERSLQGPEPLIPALTLKQRNWWELSGIPALCQKLHPVGEGFHATASEVAVTYAAYPDQVKDVEMSPKVAPVASFTDAKNYRATFPDGRIGSDPSQATPENGQTIIDTAAKALVADFNAFDTATVA